MQLDSVKKVSCNTCGMQFLREGNLEHHEKTTGVCEQYRYKSVHPHSDHPPIPYTFYTKNDGGAQTYIVSDEGECVRDQAGG